MTVDHRQQLHIQPLGLHRARDRVSDQTTHGAPNEPVRPLRLDPADLCQIIFRDFLNPARQPDTVA